MIAKDLLDKLRLKLDIRIFKKIPQGKTEEVEYLATYIIFPNGKELHTYYDIKKDISIEEYIYLVENKDLGTFIYGFCNSLFIENLI